MSKAKRDGQTIARLQQKLHEEKLKNNGAKRSNQGQRALASSGAQQDAYEFAMASLDPEHHGPYRYPDEFTEPTSVYSALNNIDLPIMVNSDPENIIWNGVSSGEYWAEIHPELDDTITYMTAENGRSTFVYMNMGEQSNLFGFKPADGSGASAYYPPVSKLTLAPGEKAHVVLPWTDKAGVLQRTRRTADGYEMLLPFFLEVAFGWFGCPKGASNKSTIEVTGLANGVPITPQSWSTQGGTSGSYDYIYNGSANEVGWGLSLMIENIPDAAGGRPVSFDLCGQAEILTFLFEAQELADVSSLRSDVEKYRVNAQSALVTYMGNVLTMAGQCATLLYRGGIPSHFNQIWNYKTVSQHQHSYNGPTVEGTYAYWEPQDTNDMIFQSIFSDNIFKRPYIVCAGIVNQQSNVPEDFEGIIRLRVVTHLEFTSKSQIYESIPSAVRPDLIVARAQILRGVPNAMENGKHLDKLKSIGKKIFSGAKKTAQFLYTHRGAIMAAGEALAPLVAL